MGGGSGLQSDGGQARSEKEAVWAGADMQRPATSERLHGAGTAAAASGAAAHAKRN